LRDAVRNLDDEFAPERLVRDLYAARLGEFRRGERLVKTEHTLPPSLLRGDMRTVDEAERIRIWEFKIRAGYDGLGQILTYVALARQEMNFARPVLGVLAAFEFLPELAQAIEVLNLGIETVVLPEKLRHAGLTPPAPVLTPVPRIPSTRPTESDASTGVALP
jgi:hypothetical protein